MTALNIIAPAKINLYLHVTGRRDGGYHELDSLIAFTDFGDEIRIEPCDSFAFNVEGPFANVFKDSEKDASPNSGNIAVKAAWGLSRAAKKNLHVKITLIKNLPLAAGIGGGSADAAAVIWGLCKFWDLPPASDFLNQLLLELGADVPVCFLCHPAKVSGIGEQLEQLDDMAELPVVVINPGKACPTANVFRTYTGAFKDNAPLPQLLHEFDEVLSFLRTQDNDLFESASMTVPEIKNILLALKGKEGCALARMSGSGASCFGIYRTPDEAVKAANNIAQDNPDWWVKAGTLGRTGRY